MNCSGLCHQARRTLEWSSFYCQHRRCLKTIFCKHDGLVISRSYIKNMVSQQDPFLTWSSLCIIFCWSDARWLDAICIWYFDSYYYYYSKIYDLIRRKLRKQYVRVILCEPDLIWTGSSVNMNGLIFRGSYMKNILSEEEHVLIVCKHNLVVIRSCRLFKDKFTQEITEEKCCQISPLTRSWKVLWFDSMTAWLYLSEEGLEITWSLYTV